MFTNFFYFLRTYGLKVSLDEWMTLLQALSLGLHDASLTGFYHLSRMIFVKSEADFDKFDQAFLEFFKNVRSLESLPQELLDWLAEAKQQREYDQAEVDRLFGGLDLAEIRRRLEQRLREQDERHDGGNKWVGTGGTSLLGRPATTPNGIRVGGEAARGRAVQVAAERRYRDFRADSTLDMRQFQMAFRRLRRLSARDEGPKDELQLEETIQSTCENGGHLKLEFGRKRANEVRLLLLFDSGGSMWPYAQLCNRLFQAAHQSSHFKELRSYYFHNCFYDWLHTTPACRDKETIPTEFLLRNLSENWKVVIVGDGAMAPSELMSRGGCLDYYRSNEQPGLYWVRRFAQRYPHLIWLNPMAEQYWDYTYGSETIRILRKEVPMYPLSLTGLDSGLRHLMAAR